MSRADTVLVTGAAGFIGRHVVEALVSLGRPVRATDLPGADLGYAASLGAEAAAGDLLDGLFAAEAVQGVSYVIHLAAAFDLGLPREVLIGTNTGTTRNIAGAAAEAGVGLFVQYSTCDVFGLKRKGPTGEDEPKKPQCAYSMSKLLSELIALDVMKRYGLPVAVVRPTFAYGRGAVYTAGSFLVLPSLLARYTDSVIIPAGGPRINTIHVEDLVSATMAVLEAGSESAGTAYNVADDSEMCAFDFLKATFEPFGIECTRGIDLPWTAIEVAGRVAGRLPLCVFDLVNRFLSRQWELVVEENDLSRLLSPRIDRDFLGFLYGEHLYRNDRIKSLGWEPRYHTFADGWQETVRWYRENSLIP